MLPEGFYTRPATMADAQIVTDLLNATSLNEEGVEKYSYEESIQEWSQPGFDLADSSILVFAKDGRLAGYTEVWDDDPVPVKSFILGRTHPDFEGLGVGSTMLAWAEKKLERVYTRVPDDSKVAVICASPKAYPKGNQFLEEIGYAHSRSFYSMVIGLEAKQQFPKVEWPDGLKLVTFDQFNDARAVYDAVEDAFRDHYGHVEAENEADGFEQWAHRLKDPDLDPTLWYILLDGDEIAGFSLCMPKADEQPDQGYVRNLGVRRAWRKRGLAKLLLLHSFREFQVRGGFRLVRLSVDADSLTGATRLYEKAGMHVERENRVFEKVLRAGVELAVI